MATRQYTFTGPVKWAKVRPGQLDRKYAFVPDPVTGERVLSPAGGKWDLIINLSGEQLKLFNALGTKTKAARLDDPERGIEKGDLRVKRNERHPKLGELGPPIVTGIEPTETIGNGSICDVVLDIYDYPQPDGTRGFAIRLVSVHVSTLVPYVKAESKDMDDKIPF